MGVSVELAEQQVPPLRYRSGRDDNSFVAFREVSGVEENASTGYVFALRRSLSRNRYPVAALLPLLVAVSISVGVSFSGR
jgi:hypothetical protein